MEILYLISFWIKKNILSQNSITSHFQPQMQLTVKGRPNGFSKPRDISAPALCSRSPVLALYSRSSECSFGTWGYHAVPILYPSASPQQWPTWESRPGGGINQLPPSLGGLLPMHHAAAPLCALLGSFPMRACWNSQRWGLCVLKSLQRGYILLRNLTWRPPWNNTEGGDFKLSFWTMKKVCGRFWLQATFTFCSI